MQTLMIMVAAIQDLLYLKENGVLNAIVPNSYWYVLNQWYRAIFCLAGQHLEEPWVARWNDGNGNKKKYGTWLTLVTWKQHKIVILTSVLKQTWNKPDLKELGNKKGRIRQPDSIPSYLPNLFHLEEEK